MIRFSIRRLFIAIGIACGFLVLTEIHFWSAACTFAALVVLSLIVFRKRNLGRYISYGAVIGAVGLALPFVVYAVLMDEQPFNPNLLATDYAFSIARRVVIPIGGVFGGVAGLTVWQNKSNNLTEGGD